MGKLFGSVLRFVNVKGVLALMGGLTAVALIANFLPANIKQFLVIK